jgi:ribosomal protein S18 acetylase RimI-like enzyme
MSIRSVRGADFLRWLGIGRSLIEAVAAHASEASATRLYRQTHESNHTAMRLYDAVAERSGFIVYRRRP